MMLTILEFLLSATIAGIVFLILYRMLQNQIRPQTEMQKRMTQLQKVNPLELRKQEQRILAGGRRRRRTDLMDKNKLTFKQRTLDPIAESIGRSLMGITPRELIQKIQRSLIVAGKQNDWPLPIFLFTCLASGVIMCVFSYFLLRTKDYAMLQFLIIWAIFTGVGLAVPYLLLNTMRKRRQKSMQMQLPECLDLLTVSVQAGLSFDGALAKIVDRMKGPLVDEFRRMQDDIRMGVVRHTALKSLAARCDVQEVSLFCTSIIQAERLGTSMGKTLKNQADNMRERHRQYVKGQAMKAPVKIIFPLVMFIFPSFFIVALAPAILKMMKNL